MSFYNIPTKIFIADLTTLIDEIALLNVNDIAVVSSPTVFRISKVQAFVHQLSKEYQVTSYADVKPDAPIDYLDEIIDHNTKPDLIVAIGGGSVIDSAKSLSLGWQSATIDELFYKTKWLPAGKIPVLAVPTTAGTGAELSYGAILFDVQKQFKSGIRGSILQPQMAFLDIELYTFAPEILIAEVGFDTLTHAVETYVSTASTALVRYQSVAAINTVLNHLHGASKGSVSDMEKMAIAATLMGQNLALSSTCLPHRIQYSLGPKTHTSHAQGLIALYKGWLDEISKTDVFRELAYEIDPEKGKLVEKIKDLKTALGINYSISQFGVRKDAIDSIANDVTGNLDNDPCYQSKETIINILTKSL